MKKTIIALSIIASMPVLANMNDHVASETNTNHNVEVSYLTSDNLSVTGVQGQIGIDDFAVTLGMSSHSNLDTYNAGLKYGGENYFGEINTTWFDVDDMNNAYDFSFGYQWGGEDSLMHVKVMHERFSQDINWAPDDKTDGTIQATNLHFGGVQVLDGAVDEGVYLTYGAGLQYASVDVKETAQDNWSESDTGVYGQVGVGYTVSGFNVEGDINYNTNLEEAIFSITAGYTF